MGRVSLTLNKLIHNVLKHFINFLLELRYLGKTKKEKIIDYKIEVSLFAT